MPKVAVDKSLLHEQAIFAYDGADYRVAKCDTAGNLVAAVLADQNIQARSYGFLGAAWQKHQMTWGYTDRWNEDLVNTNAAAGANSLVGTAVPAGYVYVVQLLAASDITSATTSILLSVYDGVAAFVALQVLAPVASQWCTFGTQITLKAGDSWRATFNGCTLGDTIRARAWGYSMKIND